MPTLVVGMYESTGKQDMPTTSVGMAPIGNQLPQQKLKSALPPEIARAPRDDPGSAAPARVKRISGLSIQPAGALGRPDPRAVSAIFEAIEQQRLAEESRAGKPNRSWCPLPKLDAALLDLLAGGKR